MEHEGDGDTNCNWYTWNDSQIFRKGAGRDGNWRRLFQTAALLRSIRIQKSPGNLKTHDSSKRPSASAGVINLQGVIINILKMVKSRRRNAAEAWRKYEKT